jgi:hypothetical protein
MLIQVTNLKSYAINAPDVYAGAVGGNVVNGLPHPFGWIGPMAKNGDSGYQKTLAMLPSDLGKREAVNGSAQTAGEKWQQLVQAGVVSLTYTAQTDTTSVEEKFVHAV